MKLQLVKLTTILHYAFGCGQEKRKTSNFKSEEI